MEILTLMMAAFCVAFSLVLAPSCASDHQVIMQKSLDEHSNYAVNDVEFVLPRKLKLNEDTEIVKNFADKDFMPHKKLMEASSDSNKVGKKEENVMHATRKGTWREWMEEGPNKSEYFSMDYGWVRRRRPIHNKQIPFAP